VGAREGFGEGAKVGAAERVGSGVGIGEGAKVGAAERVGATVGFAEGAGACELTFSNRAIIATNTTNKLYIFIYKVKVNDLFY